MAKAYFKGGAGIENPVDVNGTRIKVGDILTHSWFEDDYVAFFKEHIKITDLDEIERKVHLPNVVVKYDEEGKFFYGEGLKETTPTDLKAYMHDFMFKYTKIIMIQERQVRLQTAFLAKELKFDVPCLRYKSVIDDESKEIKNWNQYNNAVSRPTQALLQKWLREIHKLHITVTSISQESWQYHITKPGEKLGSLVEQDFGSYEEALEEGLFNALNLVQNEV